MKATFPFCAKAAARRSGWIPAVTFQSVCGLPSTAVMSCQLIDGTAPPALVERITARPFERGGAPCP